MRDWAGAYATFFAELKKPHVGKCVCWELTPVRGAAVLATSYNQQLTIEGKTFLPTEAFSETAFERTLGGAVDNLVLKGLVTDEMSELRLINGYFDDAELKVWLAIWTNPAAGLFPLARGWLGEIQARTPEYEAEVRTLMQVLQQKQSRAINLECDVAKLGDERCGVDLTSFTHDGEISSVTSNRRFTVDVVQADHYFRNGWVEFLDGDNQGRLIEVIDYLTSGQTTLLYPPEFAVVAGTSVRMVRGCDRKFTTCTGVFGNGTRFKGFPHLPTEEEALKSANAK